MNNKKLKGSCERFIESLSDKERKQFYEEHKEMLISEMIIAIMEKDEISARELARMAGLSPITVQNLRSGLSDSQ